MPAADPTQPTRSLDAQAWLDGVEPDGQSTISASRASLWQAIFIRMCIRTAVAYLLVWGVATLVGRVLLHGASASPSGWWAWGGLGLLGVLGWSAWYARWRVPSQTVIRAMLDQQQRLGGLMMLDRDVGVSAWSRGVANVEPLRVRWRGGASLASFAVALAFVLGAGLIPVAAGGADPTRLNLERTLETLSEQIAVLDEESVLDEAKADALRDETARVADEASADDPVRTWEALDHLAEQLRREAADAQEQAQRDITEAGAAGALAEAVQLADGQLSEAQLAGSMDALEQLIGEAMNGQVPPWVQDAMADAMDVGLDAETLEKLRDLMDGREAELVELMDALQGVGLGHGQFGEPVEFDPEALKDWLAEQGDGQCKGGLIAGVCKSGKCPRRGGIHRGPGHAELTWKDPANREEASFDPQVLPPSGWRDPSQSRQLGVSRTAPQVEATEGSTGGGLTHVTSEGGTASDVTILPKHRGAVQRYFERVGLDPDNGSR
ncbi:MAG: hypothetical protein AAF328_06705 [Planctomycetota bacterium]